MTQAPFAPLTDNIRALARAAMDDSEVRPILADALEETGCTDAGTLCHIREDKYNARNVIARLLAPPVYNVGPDDVDIDASVPEDAKWVIAHYTSGSYEGSGTAVAFRGGMIETANLGHCSCYGPLEDSAWNGEQMTVAEFLERDRYESVGGNVKRERKPGDYDFAEWQAIVAKGRELLQCS